MLLMFAVLRMLIFLVTAGSTTTVKVPASAKALILEARFNSLLNNGGSFGGDITVQGNHTVTGATHTQTAFIAGNQLLMSRGTVGVPGGAPGTYLATYASAQSAAIANLQNKCNAAGIL